MFTEDTQSAGHWHCCQGLSTSEYGCQSTYAQLRRPLTACVENYHLPADHLDVRKFDSAGSRSVRHRESNLQLREHVASLPMDRSGWKFPAIQRMPTDSALLQSSFPCGTHTHTHTDDSLFACVDMHAHYFGSCDLAHYSQGFKKTAREKLTSLHYKTRIPSMKHSIACAHLDFSCI